jgi:hypothetical protein
MTLLAPLKRYRRKWRAQQDWSLRDSFWGEIGTGLRGQLYFDRGGGPTDAIYLAGSARSGTSWISEVVNHDQAYRMIHEPLRRDRLRVTRIYRPRQYLRPDDRRPEYLEPMRAILSGRVRSLWTDKYNRAVLPRRRLIREVRGNLLVPWIKANWPETPLVLILRHPCAVTASQVKWEGAWPAKLDRFLAESELMTDHLEPHRDLIESTTDPFDQHVLVWGLENLVPLRGLAPGQAHVVFYEDLCLRPEPTLERLFTFLGRPVTGEALARLSRPSNSTRKDSAIVSGQSLVEGWRRSVSPDQLERAVGILRRLGLDRLYGGESTPRLADPTEVLTAI